MAIVTRARVRAIFKELEANGVNAAIVRTCCRKCAEFELRKQLRRKKTPWVLLPAFDGSLNPTVFDRAGVAKGDLRLSFSGDERQITKVLRSNGFKTALGQKGDQPIIIVRRRYRAINQSGIRKA
jgi:hypothetical protein